MIKSILFDFYGTIAIYGDMKVGEEKTWRIIYDYLCSKANMPGYDEFINQWNNIFNTPISLAEKTEATILLTKISQLFKTFNAEYNSSLIANIGEMCLNTWQSYISFPEDMDKVFKFLKSKYSIALVSNFDHPVHVRKLLRENHIEEYFDSIIISGECGICKPKFEIFEKAFNELGILPYKSVFIGDSMKDDIEGAQLAGCKTILIDIKNRYNDYRGNKINSISELIDYNFDRL